MKNKRNRDRDNCIPTNVTCVKWNLPPIPCLGIETGDYLDDITFALVSKVCQAFSDQDLSDIDIQCIIDRLNITEPSEKTVATFLQLASDNNCRLYDLIQAVKELITNDDSSLSLDLKCLAQYDSYGNQLPYNEQSVLQSLINQGCSLIGQIAGLSSAIQETNIRIDNLPAPYTEPNLSTCLSGTPKSLSQTVQLLASDYCTYKEKVGLDTQIDAAISQFPDTSTNLDFPNSDLLPLVSALADGDYNQNILLKYLYEQVLALQACACKVKCDDVKIGYEVFDDNEDGSSVTVSFNPEYGFYLPSGAIPQEVKITFIDRSKKQLVYTVLNPDTTFIPGFSPVYNISALDLNAPITIKVCTKIQINGTEICCNCEEKEHMFVGGCDFCSVTATDTVTIIYKIC